MMAISQTAVIMTISLTIGIKHNTSQHFKFW
jgi:hypothetical protein